VRRRTLRKRSREKRGVGITKFGVTRSEWAWYIDSKLKARTVFDTPSDKWKAHPQRFDVKGVDYPEEEKKEKRKEKFPRALSRLYPKCEELFTYRNAPEKAPDYEAYYAARMAGDEHTATRLKAMEDAHYVREMTDMVAEQIELATGDKPDKEQLYRRLLLEYLKEARSRALDFLPHTETPTMKEWNMKRRMHSFLVRRIKDNLAEKFIEKDEASLKEILEGTESYYEDYRSYEVDPKVREKALRDALGDDFKIEGNIVKPKRSRIVDRNPSSRSLPILVEGKYLKFFTVKDGKMKIRQMSEDRVTMIDGTFEFDIKLPDGRYEVLHDGGDKTALRHPDSIEYVPFTNTIIFKKATKSGVKTYEVIFDKPDEHEDIGDPPVPRIPFTSSAEFRVKELKDLMSRKIKTEDGYAAPDVVVFEAGSWGVGDFMRIYTKDFEGKVNAKIVKTAKEGASHRDEKLAKAVYAASHLRRFLKNIPNSATVKISFADDLPLKIEVDVPNIGKFDYYQAPMIERG